MKRIGFFITLAVALSVLVISIFQYRKAFSQDVLESSSSEKQSIRIVFDCPSVTSDAYLGAMLVGANQGPESVPFASFDGSISNGSAEIFWDNLDTGIYRLFFMIRQKEDNTEGLIPGDITNNRYIQLDVENMESITIKDGDLMTH